MPEFGWAFFKLFFGDRLGVALLMGVVCQAMVMTWDNEGAGG